MFMVPLQASPQSCNWPRRWWSSERASGENSAIVATKGCVCVCVLYMYIFMCIYYQYIYIYTCICIDRSTYSIYTIHIGFICVQAIFHHICMSYLILAEGFARLLDSPNLSCFFMQHADLFRAPGWMLRSRRRQRMFFFCAGVHGIKRMASHLQNINLQILLQKQYDIRYLIEKMLEKKNDSHFWNGRPFLRCPPTFIFRFFLGGIFWVVQHTSGRLSSSCAMSPTLCSSLSKLFLSSAIRGNPRRVRWCRKEISIPESPRRNSNLHIPLAPQNHGFSGKLGPQNERKLILERPTFHWTMITGGRVFLFWQWCFHDFWKFGIFLPHAIVFDHSPASSTAQNWQGGPLEACEHQPSADQMRLVWTFPHHF